ncbi:MAG: two-component regulator propeller domain-containing protein, partial [Chitinophagales bacterium]
MQRRLIVIACFFIFTGCFAQQYPFINYTPNDGLVNNRVRSMYQDSKGRLYFLTFGGLSVYDGARFLNYGPAEGLASDIVNDVLEITPDSLWVATNTNHVNCLVNGKIKSLKTPDGFYPVINSFLKNSNGTIYVAADDGLFIWQDQKFRRLSFLDTGREPVQYLVQIREVGDLLLILVNPFLSENAGTLCLYDPVQQKILYAEKKFITYSTTISPEGDVWLSTNKGVRVLKKEQLQKGIFKDEDVPQSFAAVQNKKGSFIKFDNLGQLWLSVYNEDLLFIKPGAAPVLYNESNGLGSTLISYIFQDKEGNDWFLPEGKGAQKLVSNNIEFVDHPFEKAFINDLYAQTQSDSVWLYDGILGQLILLYRNTKKIFFLSQPPLKNGHLLAKGSLIWLYNDKNIFRVNVPAAGVLAAATLIFKDSSLQTGYGVIDPYSNLIYCADNQLKIFQKNKIATSYPLDYFAEQLSFDQSGHLWIATRSNKLQVFTLHPEDPVHYLQLQYDLSSQMHLQNPRSLAIDDSGRIWIGTRFDGLYCFRFSKNRLSLLQHFTRKEGLTDNFVNYL